MSEPISVTIEGVTVGGSGTSDFDELENRPSYNGTEMTHATSIPEVKTATWDAKADAEDIPTKTSDLTNDSGFITNAKAFVATYGTTTATEVAAALTAGKAVVCDYTQGDVHCQMLLETESDSKYTFVETGVSTYNGVTSVYGHGAALNKTTNEWEHVSGSGTIPSTAEQITYDSTLETHEAGSVGAALSSQSSQIEELEDEQAYDEASASERYEGVDLTVKFADEIANYSDEWAWIKARITAHNYSGLRVHDYIPVTCSNGYVLKEEIAGFDTYKYSGSPEIGNHIDFISKDCWPDTIQWNPVNNTNGFAFIFTGDGSTTDFTCDTTATGRSSHTFTNFPYYIDRVWFGTTEQSSGWSYNRETGVVHFNTAPASGTEIVAQSCTGFFSSKVYAWLNSIKTVVPNATTAEGDLLDVDYTAGGVYYYLPQKLKNVITGKNAAWPTFYKKGTLLSSPDNNKWLTSLPLWLPDEMEVYGTPMFATGTYAKWFGRWYPCFFNGIRKKGSGNGAYRAYWWLSVPPYSAYVCLVGYSGGATNSAASASSRCPVCFRVTA